MRETEHILAVRKWLDEHVLTYATPKLVMLSGFKVKPREFSGSFDVTLDDVKIPLRFSFGLGGNGKPTLYFPMFYSPLGAPASYPSVELSDTTKVAVENLLASILPPMKALGYDGKTGEYLYHTTHPLSARIIGRQVFNATMHQIAQSDFTAYLLVNAGV